MEIGLHGKHACTLKFAGNISTEWKGIGSHKGLLIFPLSSHSFSEPSLLFPTVPCCTELWSSPGDHVSLLLKVKGPVSLLSSLLASAVAISTVAFDQMAPLHLILGSGASPQENVISVFSPVS